MIRNKLWTNVPDELCQRCPQLWEGECRAFMLPHSLGETSQRVRGALHEGKVVGLCNLPPAFREFPPLLPKVGAFERASILCKRK